MAMPPLWHDLDPLFAFPRMPACKDEARDIADRNMQKLVETFRAWKTYRNTLSPISILPRELLVQIFLYVRDSIVVAFDDAKPYSPPDPDERNKWVGLGHVCRHWRILALDCKALWRSIGIAEWYKSTDFRKFQLEKSHPLPIDLNAYFSSEHRRSRVIELLAREPRINLNKLALSGDGVSEVLARLDSGSSTLQYLCLQNADEVPKSLFGGQTPELRQIRVAGCSKIAWDAGIFRSPRITHLVLENLCTDKAPSWSQLEQILLSIAHSLKVLAIIEAFPKDVAAEAREVKPRLTQLQRLEVHGKPVSVNAFLNSIQIPSSTAIDARMSGHHDRLEKQSPAMASTIDKLFLDFFSALHTSMSSSYELKRLALELRPWDDTVQLSVQGFKTLNEPSFKLTYIHRNVDMRFHGVDDLCARCGQEWHAILSERSQSDGKPHGRPNRRPNRQPNGDQRQPVDVSLCDDCTGPCHRRAWFPMEMQDEAPIPGISFDRLEVVELRLKYPYAGKRITRVPTGLWRTLVNLPRLREIAVGGFCLGSFGELWMGDATSFPSLKHLKFESMMIPPILIKRLRDGLKIRQDSSDRHLQILEFTRCCRGLTEKDVETIFGQYVPSLIGPKPIEWAKEPQASLQWPPPPEETAEARFNRMALQLGYTR